MQQLGKYNVIRRLGVGGMAEVFLCKLTGIGGFEKHVVLKKIRADIATDDEFITMFFDEARLAANLSHPNIIQVFEVDQLDGTPYIAMEYVRGATLATVLQKLRAAQRRMDFSHAAYVFAGVCAGLDHAHNAADASGRLLRIVHRDISPQNIIVSSDGTPKIFDFGVAKARGSLSLTGVDQVKGKFGYMAPEQLRAQPVDAKADVFAVGVCMYEAITGKRPFTGGSEAELYAARHAGKFRMPSELVPEIPVDLEHMILSAMAPDPSDRPTALELQAALATFCGTGTKYASSAHAITPWLKDLLGEQETEAYESYASSNPSMTPLPRSANLPPTKHAVEARRQRRPNTNSLIIGLGLAAILLTAVLAVIVLKKQRPEPTIAASAPPREPAEPSLEQDATVRAFLDEAQKYLADKKLGLAADLLDKASQLESRDSALAIRRTELRHKLEIERGRVLTHDAIAARDWQRAIELSNQLLVRDPNDTDAMKLLTEARRGQDTQLPAVAVAPRTEHTVAVESRKAAPVQAPPAKKKLVVVAKSESVTKSAAGSGAGSATRIAAGSGAGSASRIAAGSGADSAATKSAGSAAMPAAGSGSAQVAAQIAPRPAPIAAPPKPAITAVPIAPAQTVGPGSLDATPSFAKVSVDGSLTTTEVRNALTRSLDTLRTCYRAAAKRANQTPDVSIRVSFEIDEGARAGSVRIVGADSLGLGACARQAISDVRTRVAPDVGTVSVSAVVRFKPTR